MSTAQDSDNDTWTMMIDVMLGSTCRIVMAILLLPVLTAARTYSMFRSESPGPRAARMKMGM